MIDVKDRVPSQVLINGAIRYEEFDAAGNSLGYRYIKRADEPTEAGTPVNKALFDSIKTDINKTSEIHQCTYSQSGTIFGKQKTKLFPNEAWEAITADVKYQSADFIIEASSAYSSARNAIKAFDGDDSSYWSYSSSQNSGTLTVDCGQTHKIYEFEIKYSSSGSVVLKASNDNVNFVDLATLSEVSSKTTQIISIDEPAAYRYYRLYNYGDCKIYEFQATKIESGANLLMAEDSFVSDYFDGMQIYIKVPDSFKSDVDRTYLKIKDLNAKEVKGSLHSNRIYKLIYDGTQFNVFTHKLFEEETVTLSSTETNKIDLSDLADYSKVELLLDCVFVKNYTALTLNGAGIREYNTKATSQNITQYSYVSSVIARVEIDICAKLITTYAYGQKYASATGGAGAVFDSPERHVYRYDTLESFSFGLVSAKTSDNNECKIVKYYKEV